MKLFRIEWWIQGIASGFVSVWMASVEQAKLSEYISPSLFHTNKEQQTDIASTNVFTLAASRTLIARPRTDYWIDRWTRFQAEYGLRTDYHSPATYALGRAKYAVDYTSLAMEEFTETLRDKFQFEYQLRNMGRTTPLSTPPRRVRTSIILDAWEHARFQSSLDLQITGRSFVGLKLVIPFGE